MGLTFIILATQPNKHERASLLSKQTMKKSFIYFVIITGLLSCNSETVLQSDIEVLIDNKKKSTEIILGQLQEFIQKHGREGFENQSKIVEDFSRSHENVISFLDSLDAIEKQHRHTVATRFIRETFHGYEIKYPYEESLTENTPIGIIKLQIVDVENTYLRKWEENVTYRFNKMTVAILPDKIEYHDTDKITGRVGFWGYSDELKLKIRMNEKDIEVKDGIGHFSIDPNDLKGQENLEAQIIFPDTVYTTSILIKKKRR